MSETADSAFGLERLGWTDAFAAAHEPHAALGRAAARVVAEDRGSYVVLGPSGEQRAVVSGRLRFDAEDDPAAFPAVGDWVATEGGIVGETVIHAVLPRRSALVRQAAGRRTEAQVVGANLDVVFVVASLNGDLNLRRLERYVAAAWESAAEPVVLLSKADLGADIEAGVAGVGSVAAGAAVLVVSSFDGRGVDEVRSRIGPGRTAAFVGSSGVGKSTLLNRLAGEEIAATQEIREDDARGRHTTTRRQLHVLPGGGLVLDTPGMRELALWDGDGLERTFADVDELATSCRFGNCSHHGEPGCAIAAALADGSLEGDRHESWLKLRREAAHHERRVDALARNADRRKWKQVHKSVRGHMDAKYGAEGWR
ncbi:MAG TPA: ribosome small subunit-dependent GTPase A [Candidatus Limnocylindrales bacterium]|nr:ribosome small subunit-dependent GTPase A [Candidatus Limnocylindrales bacterium]